MTYKRILVAIDGSETSELALQEAAKLATQKEVYDCWKQLFNS